MRTRPMKRLGLAAGLLSLAIPGATALPAVAQTGSKGTSAAAAASQRISVSSKRLDVRLGGRIAVTGRIRTVTPGAPVALEALHRGTWRTLDRGRTRLRGRYVLAVRRRATLSAPLRVVARAHRGRRTTVRRIGRANVYRVALASWYGPGLYGNRTGCGGRLGPGSLGVAHKSLPCGTKVTFRHRGRSVRVPVMDRGPYVGGREYDLTSATAQRIGFRGHGAILATR